MEKNSSFAKIVFALALIATLIGFSAFSQTKSSDSSVISNENKSGGTGNFDDLEVQMKHLDLQMNHLDQEMKHLDLKVQQQLNIALKKVDAERISEKVNESLKRINWEQINRKIDANISRLSKEDLTDAKRGIENAMRQLENQKFNIHFTAPNIDTRKIRLHTEEAMSKARKSMEKARESLKNMQEFTNALQHDGLIDKSKPYKIEVKDGDLYINGTKQSKEVSDKYRQYYKKNSFTINMNEDNGVRI